jgi:hypothetical protein
MVPKICMGATRHLINQSERKFSQKKYLKRVEESKIRVRATRRNLQVQPKILKKFETSNQPIRSKMYPKKDVDENLLNYGTFVSGGHLEFFRHFSKIHNISFLWSRYVIKLTLKLIAHGAVFSYI